MTDFGPKKNVHRKTWTMMTIFVHKIHIKTYGSNDRPWSKKCTQKTFGPRKCPQKNMDSDDNFCAQDPHKNLWFQ